MNGRIVFAILLVLALIAGAAGIGIVTYNAGVAQGMVESGKVAAPAQGRRFIRTMAPTSIPSALALGSASLACCSR